MASRFYGANFGASTPKDVTEAGSGTGLNVDVQIVYDATANGRLQAIRALNAILDYLKAKETWPPA